MDKEAQPKPDNDQNTPLDMACIICLVIVAATLSFGLIESIIWAFRNPPWALSGTAIVILGAGWVFTMRDINRNYSG